MHFQSTVQAVDLKSALASARARPDELFRLVQPESLYERPVPERHRMVFYLGHLEAFDWNQLGAGALSMTAFHPEFDRLFAFGIDPPQGQLPGDGASDWPSLKEIYAYNRRVREKLDKVLDDVPEEMMHVAIEHRLMHAETFAYILHNLSHDRKIGQISPARMAGSVPHRMIEVPAGHATLGRDRQEGFGWDNEFSATEVHVPAFSISKYKVTNGQYLEFVRAGSSAPHFWSRRDGQWHLRTMFGDVPLPLDWPVFVTHDEAQSYADWAGMALPTEAQFHHAAYGTRTGEERQYPWGDEPPDRTRGNFDFQGWDPVPVTSTPAGNSAFEVAQLVGNGWEWTSTVFNPFAGFQPFPFYPGYSQPFFSGGHYVMKGGSARTAARLLRRSFRNWFRPNYRYLHTGFRCVEN